VRRAFRPFLGAVDWVMGVAPVEGSVFADWISPVYCSMISQ